MEEVNTEAPVVTIDSAKGFKDEITELLKRGARQMLQAAIEEEVSDYVAKHSGLLDEKGFRLVVRNGHHPERDLQTGIGGITIKKPKVNDKRIDEGGERMRFQSAIIPPYLKKTKSVEELIPWLYLRGISTGDFPLALESILGKNAAGLSSTSVVRLKKHWEDDFTEWNKRDLSEKRYVYFWADGVYPKVRLDKSDSQCLLVIMGATADGKKELVAIGEGLRESELAWREVLLDLKKRGLATGPELAAGDGAIVSGQLSAKNTLTLNTSVAGFTKSATSSASCPKAAKAKQGDCLRTSICRKAKRPLKMLWTIFARRLSLSTQRR